MSATRRVAQALDALRHGWAIRVEGAGGALDLLPVDGQGDGMHPKILGVLMRVGEMAAPFTRGVRPQGSSPLGP